MTREEIIKKVRDIRIETGRKVTSRLIGSYRSAFRGQGMSFSEIRKYYSGDDVRFISWTSTAKNRKLFVKDYKEDRSVNLIFAVDCSKTMEFWSKEITKKEFTAEIIASLSFAALKVGDRVGGVFFNDVVEEYIKPKASLKNALTTIDTTLTTAGIGKANYSLVENFLRGILKDTSIILFFSDFLMDKEIILNSAKSLQRLNIKHQVIPVMMMDPVEKSGPFLGFYKILDPESGKVRNVLFSESTAAAYKKRIEEHTVNVSRIFTKHGLDIIPITLGEDYVKKFSLYFKKKSGRF